MKNSMDEVLEEARAEAAYDALSRHERGEPQPEEAAFTDDEVKEMTRLRPAADPAADEALTAALQSALASATDRRHDGPAIPSRGPGSVSPLRVLTRFRVTVAATFAMAAALAVLVVQPYSFEGEPGQALVHSGDRVLGAAEPSSASVLSGSGCLELPIRTTTPLSDSLTAHAYFQRGDRTVPWDIGPKVTNQKLTLAPCAPLPAGLSAGDWTLVLLIGYPGRLHWLGRQALTQAAPGASSSYRGLQVVRQPVRIASEP